MLDISKLTQADKGREVRYRARSGEKTEWGRIMSWSDRVVFVRYHTQQWEGEPVKPRRSYSSEATDPSDLEFVSLENSDVR